MRVCFTVGNFRFSDMEEMQIMSNPWMLLEIHWQTMPFSTDFKLVFGVKPRYVTRALWKTWLSRSHAMGFIQMGSNCIVSKASKYILKNENLRIRK